MIGVNCVNHIDVRGTKNNNNKTLYLVTQPTLFLDADPELFFTIFKRIMFCFVFSS